MYVDLNCIISSGIVYNLFTGEEKAEVIGNARQMKEYEELNNIDDNLFWDYIMKKVREKCRVFICMNPLNKNFTKILRLSNENTNTNNENKDEENKEGRNQVRGIMKKRTVRGSSILSHSEKETMVDKLSHIFAKVFTEINKQSDKYFIQTRKKVIILPKSFLDFIEFFLSFKDKHSHKLEDDIKKYKWGVKCIEEAGEQIKLMQELLEKQIKL